MSYTYKISQDNKEWDSLAAKAFNADFLQSSAWAKVKGPTGWDSYKLIISNDKKVVAVCLFLIRKVAKGKISLGYTTKGPCILDKSAEPGEIIQAITDFAKSKSCDYLSMDSFLDIQSKFTDKYVSALELNGYKKSAWVQRPNTGVVDISKIKNIDDLKPNLSKRRRTTVNKLYRNEEFEFSAKGISSLKEYMKLHEETAKLKGFPYKPYSYNKAILDYFNDSKHGDAFLGLVHHKESGQLVSAGLMIGWANTYTYYSGASVVDRKLSEASSIVQLESMIEASKRGFKLYDLGGAPADIDDPKDPFQAVWRFKSSLGAELVQSPGCWSKSLTVKGRLVELGQKVRNVSG